MTCNTLPRVRLCFPLGQILATPGALALLEGSNVSPMDLIARHVVGDWGAVCAEDARANIEALATGSRLLSCYFIHSNAEKVWLITEADRSATTILLPDEY